MERDGEADEEKNRRGRKRIEIGGRGSGVKKTETLKQ